MLSITVVYKSDIVNDVANATLLKVFIVDIVGNGSSQLFVGRFVVGVVEKESLSALLTELLIYKIAFIRQR